MKKLRGSLAAKAVAVLLLTCTALAFVASFVAVGLLYTAGAYNGPYNVANALNHLGEAGVHRAAGIVQEAVMDDGILESWELEVQAEDDFCFVLYDKEGKVLYDGLKDRDTIWGEDYYSYRMHYEFLEGIGYEWQNWFTNRYKSAPATALYRTAAERPEQEPEVDEELGSEGTFFLQGYIPQDLDLEGETYRVVQAYANGYSLRGELLAAIIVFAVLSVLLLAFLMCAAGHRGSSDTVTAGVLERVPFDLLTVVVGMGECLGVACMDEILSFHLTESFFLVLLVLLTAVMVPAGILYCMSFAVRFKLRTVLSSCLCWRLLVWAWQKVRAVLGWCRRAARGFFGLLQKIPILRRAVFGIAVLLFLEFFVVVSTTRDTGVELFLWFVKSAALTAGALYAVFCLQKLQKGLKEIAGGNETYAVDTRYLRGDFQDSAQDLNHIREGMILAVNERMKSERFRTELITNVSHDIRTPLTSIINYVDLLSKEEPENEKMREYIEVLSRQSARLKKLTDDLIEASKASTGSLPVNRERCELNVLLDQSVGEYGERLSAAQLELVVKKPEEPVTVLADGRHTWRIFDNLLSNICKYSQPGTRVYLDLERQGGKAVITFRNISRNQLNINSDELMERFVRGDSSRNTEGSGLGLSIARSLAQLQGGELELTVDGDLFKVTLRFDAV